MCGRYRNAGDTAVIESTAGTTEWRGNEKFRPGHNASPTTYNPVVTQAPDGARTVHVMRWGLIPSWVKDANSLPTLMFNARGETVVERPAFRGSFKAGKRCVVIVDGFYEWYRGYDPQYANPKGSGSQPYFVARSDGGLMKMAGLYDIWKNEKGEDIYSYTIITVASDGTVLSWLHDRMPVILSEDGAEDWLNTKTVDSHAAKCTLIKQNDKNLQWVKMTADLTKALPANARVFDIASAFAKTVTKRKIDDSEAKPEKETPNTLQQSQETESKTDSNRKLASTTPSEINQKTVTELFTNRVESPMKKVSASAGKPPAKKQRTVDQFFQKQCP